MVGVVYCFDFVRFVGEEGFGGGEFNVVYGGEGWGMVGEEEVGGDVSVVVCVEGVDEVVEVVVFLLCCGV